MKPSGHWFCERCDDVVHLPASVESPAKCPVCHQLKAIWISSVAQSRRSPALRGEGGHTTKPVSDEVARQWFDRIRETIAAAP